MFNITAKSLESLVVEFDEIARNMLFKQKLVVQEHEFDVVEIEFYYYDEGFHKDNSVHDHCRESGGWRSHNSGLDVTFGSTKSSDGGILIRSIRKNGVVTSGPRNVVSKIFECLGPVSSINKKFGFVERVETGRGELIRTFRHGLGANGADFRGSLYRYIVDVNEVILNSKELSRINANHERVAN